MNFFIQSPLLQDSVNNSESRICIRIQIFAIKTPGRFECGPAALNLKRRIEIKKIAMVNGSDASKQNPLWRTKAFCQEGKMRFQSVAAYAGEFRHFPNCHPAMTFGVLDDLKGQFGKRRQRQSLQRHLLLQNLSLLMKRRQEVFDTIPTRLPPASKAATLFEDVL